VLSECFLFDKGSHCRPSLQIYNGPLRVPSKAPPLVGGVTRQIPSNIRFTAAHTSLPLKRNLDRFSRFCTVQPRAKHRREESRYTSGV